MKTEMKLPNSPSVEVRSREDRVLDYSFLAGIGLKILNIIGDVLVGIPLLFIQPHQIGSFIHKITASELLENPNDKLSNFLVHTSAHVTHGSLIYLGIYFLLHGLVKIGIIVALVRASRNVYPWAIGALVALLLYQIISISIHFSLTLTVLSVLDLVIILLTLREWYHHRTLQDVLMYYAPKVASRWPFRSVQPES
jgi:uncharacterized membrane protein